MSVDSFLDRCLNVEKLVIEGLNEGSLRKLLQGLGVPAKDIKEFRTLKLLDRIVCMAQLAATTELSLANDGALLWDRLSKGAPP